MEYLIKLFFILTNGRLMYYNRTMYDDLTKPLHLYYDFFGRYWISQNKWGFIRLKWMKKCWIK